MVAFWGLPGTNQFGYKRGVTRDEGRAWIESEWARCPQDQEHAVAYRQSHVLSNRDAAMARYADGRRVVSSGGDDE